MQCKKIYESPDFADDLIEITEKIFEDSSIIVLTDDYEKPVHFDPLTDFSPYPTLMILEGTDGGRNHAIATVDKWVFDSNLPLARPLTLDTLNWCVSTDTESQKFVKVAWAIRKVPKPPRIEMHFLHEAPPTIHHCLALLMHLIDEVKLHYAFKNCLHLLLPKKIP